MDVRHCANRSVDEAAMKVKPIKPVWSRRSLRLAVMVLVASIAVEAAGQTRPRQRRARVPARRVTPAAQAGMITISYPDSVNLAAFVDYVSQSLDIKIIYGDEVRNQTVVFRPGEVQIPKEQLLDLLRSMLRMRDLAIVEGDVEGWLRIIQVNDMQRYVDGISHEGIADKDGKSNRVATHVVRIASSDMSTIVKHARSFLSSSKASVIEIPDKKLIIITDYESAIAKALEIIKLLDTGSDRVQILTVPVAHVDAKILGERIQNMLSEKAKFEGRKDVGLSIQPDVAAGSLLLIGHDEAVEQARALIERFDVSTVAGRDSIAYQPTYITADRLQRLIEAVVVTDASALESMRLFLDEQTNRLYVTAPTEVHHRIATLLKAEDVPTSESSRPLRIYKPKNRLAGEMLGTLSAILPNVLTSTAQDVSTASIGSSASMAPGPNRPPGPAGPGQVLPLPPAQDPIRDPGELSTRVTRVEGADFILSSDEHTNSIIAIGPREFHSQLKALIEVLDKRQPQVLIEMTLVAVTFNDSLSLAVELANVEQKFDGQSTLFSSFGLSNIDLATGERSFNPGGGLNWVLLGPRETPILLRMIAAHGNSRIITTPHVIVKDNTSASISNVEEAPFTSINASDTVATTSFAGFESAGTSLSVTPHIAQGDHLSLDYSFNFSNFTGGGSVGVPPPRTTNTFSGSVEIPDGHTIIVGGMVTENEADSVTEVPLLGRIPILGVLFQSSDRARTKSRIYAFIKATILRDDQFADLKMISQDRIERAEIANTDYPESEYLWMR